MSDRKDEDPREVSDGSGQADAAAPNGDVGGAGQDSAEDTGSGTEIGEPGGAVPGPGVQEGEPLNVEELRKLLPPENEELLLSILEIASNPESARVRLYTALNSASFLVPLASEPPAPPEGGEGEASTVEVVTLSGPNQELVLPAFTHEAALTAWASGRPPTVTLQGSAVFGLTAASPIQLVVINPAGPFGGQVSRPEIEALAQGQMPEAQPTLPLVPPDPGSQVFVDAPLVPIPEATEDELIELLENNEAVASAHLFLMQVGEAAAPQLKIGIWSNGSGAQWLPQQYARLLRQKQLSFEPFDVPEMVILNEIPGGENLRDNLPPFYQSDEDAAAQAGQGNGEDAEDLDEESEDLDEAEDFGEEAGDEGEETGERGEESHDAEAPPADAPPRRRGFWPFGKK